MATIKIPPVLRGSVGGEKEVEASGSDVGEVLRRRHRLDEFLQANFPAELLQHRLQPLGFLVGQPLRHRARRARDQ